MDTNQAIRLQCLELAVKAGTPWNRLTDTADMLTAYVRGVNARVAADQIGSLTPAGLDEYRRTGMLSTETAISPADKGVAVEETMPSSAWKFPAYLGDPSYSKTLAAVEDEMAKGVPVEDSPTWPTDMPQEEIERREALMRNGDFGKTAMLGSALRATLPEDQRGEPVESPALTRSDLLTMKNEPDQPSEVRTAVMQILRGLPPESPPPGVIDDPRLPMVTM